MQYLFVSKIEHYHYLQTQVSQDKPTVNVLIFYSKLLLQRKTLFRVSTLKFSIFSRLKPQILKI